VKKGLHFGVRKFNTNHESGKHMKEIFELMPAVLFLFCFSVSAWSAEKKEYALNFSAGELPGAKLIEKYDLSLSDKHVCAFELTSENAKEGGKLLKAALTKKKEKFGAAFPRISDWSKWDGLKFKVYNPQSYSVKISFVVRDRDLGYGPPGGNDWGFRSDAFRSIGPGWNEIEIDFTILSVNDAKTYINLKKMLEWHIYAYDLVSEPAVLYFTDFEFFTE